MNTLYKPICLFLFGLWMGGCLSAQSKSEKCDCVPFGACDPSDSIYCQVHVDSMAQYPGGKDSLYNFLLEHFKWPNPEECWSGLIIANLLIGKDGMVRKAVIVRSLSKVWDDELLRVIRLMPCFRPAILHGRNVASYYLLPLKIDLQ